MSLAVAPERFALDPRKPAIAVAKPLVPAVGCIIDPPIIPPIDIEIGRRRPAVHDAVGGVVIIAVTNE